MGSIPTPPVLGRFRVVGCLGSSMVEQATVNRWVVGSSPIRDGLGCIAQLVERWPFKPRVLGSSPSAPKNC